MKILISLFALALGLAAQSVLVPGDGGPLALSLQAQPPTGGCTPSQRVYVYSTGHDWGCVGTPGAFAWTDLGGPLTSISDQVGNDMGLNEDHPQGVPASYGYWSGSFINIGNAFTANGKGATLPWAALYPGTKGLRTTNTSVQVRNFRICVLTTSWTCTGFAGSSIIGEFDSEDFQNYIGSATFVVNSDGSFTLPIQTGTQCEGTTPADLTNTTCLTHFYANSRAAVNAASLVGIVAYMEARLTLINPSGVDDRANSNFLLEMGADAYISTSSNNDGNPVPAVGGGKFKLVSTAWRSYSMSTLSAAQLSANPPPMTAFAAP